jgi:hypothetical protein
MNLLRYRLHLSSGHGALASMLYDPEGAWVNIQDVEAYLRKNAEIKPDQSTHDKVANLKADTSGWRSVYEEMPPENVDVLVWIRRYAVIAQRVGTTEENEPVFVRADDYVSIHPIYWQPITPPTNE